MYGDGRLTLPSQQCTKWLGYVGGKIAGGGFGGVQWEPKVAFSYGPKAPQSTAPRLRGPTLVSPKNSVATGILCFVHRHTIIYT